MTAEPQITQRPPQPYAGLAATATMTNLASVVDAGFPEVFSWLGRRGIEPAGPPFIRYHVVDMDGDRFKNSSRMDDVMRAYQDLLKDLNVAATDPAISHPTRGHPSQ